MPSVRGKLDGRLERGLLLNSHRIDHARIAERREARRHSVIAQPARMDRRRHEAMSKRVHLDDRRHLGRVAVIERIHALCKRRRRRGLNCQEPRALAVLQVLAQERVRNARKVGAAAHAADHHVRVFIRHIHLLQRFFADHALVQQHMVQHRAQAVLLLAARCGSHLHRLRDGDPQRTGAARILRQH